MSKKRKKLRNKFRRILENRNFAQDLKRNGKCIDCGNSDYRVLEFDHLPKFKKTFNIGGKNACSLDKFKKEVEKCELRCANCHKVVTYERWMAKRKQLQQKKD